MARQQHRSSRRAALTVAVVAAALLGAACSSGTTEEAGGTDDGAATPSTAAPSTTDAPVTTTKPKPKRINTPDCVAYARFNLATLIVPGATDENRFERYATIDRFAETLKFELPDHAGDVDLYVGYLKALSEQPPEGIYGPVKDAAVAAGASLRDWYEGNCLEQPA